MWSFILYQVNFSPNMFPRLIFIDDSIVLISLLKKIQAFKLTRDKIETSDVK